MRLLLAYSAILISFVASAQSPKKNPGYLMQEPPGKVPKVFAPGLISLEDQLEFGSIFSKNGKAFFYAVDVEGKAEIRFMKLVGKEWTVPEKVLSDEQYSYNDPYLSPDESKLYFISDRPMDGKGDPKDYDVWYVPKKGNKWGEPVNAGTAINSQKNEYYVSITGDGTIYFSSNAETGDGDVRNFDIYRSRFLKGKFEKATKLSEAVNSRNYEADVFVAYDESYLIFCADRPEGNGKGDLYVTFRNSDGSWTNTKSMGKSFNTTGDELCPFVTRDGKYFFYSSNRDIYWVDAGVINDFR